MKPTIHQLTIPTPFLVGPVHLYLIEDEQLTLIDTGPNTEEAWEAFVNQLSVLGFRPEDIGQVVLTHHHPDHIGFSAKLRKTATIIGHRLLKPWIEKEEAFFKEYAQFFYDFFEKHGLTKALIKKVESTYNDYISFVQAGGVDVIVEEGDQVPNLRDWTVYEVPGHAQSHIMLLHNQEKCAISGDVLLAKISTNALLEAPVEGQEKPKSLLQYRQSLQKLKELQVTKIFPGHGPIIEDVEALVDRRLDAHSQRAEKLKTMIGVEEKTATEICHELFPDLFKLQPDLTFSETYGHLELLLEDNQLQWKEENGVVFFYGNNE